MRETAGRRTAGELLDWLRRLEEHERVEAKKGFGRAALETVVAFSNEPGLGGGYLLFGVQEDDAAPGGYRVVGVAEPERLSAELATQCAGQQLNRPIRPRIWTDTVDDRVVVAAYVPELPAAEKPVYLKNFGLPRGAYRRVASTDQAGSDADLDDYRALANERPYEDTLVADAGMADLDESVIGEYRKVLVDAQPATELRGATLHELVQAVGGSRQDEAGVSRPTVAGLLLFGSALALRRLMPGVRVDYVRVAGTEWASDAEAPFETLLEVRAPLLVAFRRIYQAVLDDMPRSARMEAGDPRRHEDTRIPARVIREALVNALMHRNYRVHQPVQVLRYANRIEIRNPGYSLVGDEQLGKPGSRTRNPRIADVFREMGLAEVKGTGIGVMRREMVDANLSPPVFESDRGDDLFASTLLVQHLLGNEDRAWLARFRDFRLSDEQAIALVYARERGEVRNASLRALAGLDTLAASQTLRHLRDLGLLDQRHAGSATAYVLAPMARGEAAGAPGKEIAPAVGGGEGEQLTLPGTAGVRGDKARQTQGLAGQTQGFEPETQGLPLRDELPERLLERLDRLGRRTPTAKLRAVVFDLCRLRAYTPGELAVLLGRKDVANLVRAHLSPMVEEGRLVRTHPDTPAHPRQAYRAEP